MVRKGKLQQLQALHNNHNLTMNEIITILNLLSPALAPKTLKQLIVIYEAMLAMTGRVTMLSLSCWTEKGGSYRSH
jgi:putative transposase